MNCNPTRAYSLVVMGAVLHFLVDGLCLCCLYLMAGDGEASGLVGVFIAYNMLALLLSGFGLSQAPGIGKIAIVFPLNVFQRK